MPIRNLIRALEMTNFNAANLSGVYQPINAKGCEKAVLLMRVINTSNTDIFVSYNGITNNDFVSKNSILELNFSPLSHIREIGVQIPQGTIAYVKGRVGIGQIYLVGYTHLF
jgi:hypothetical protein